MMLRQWLLFVCMTALVGLGCALPAMAQTPGVLYTWDQSYGQSVGPDVEGWYGDANIALDNNTDGVLTITESDTAGFNVNDSWNRIKESANGMDAGGLDLTGLQGVQFTIGHNGTATIGGKLFMQAPSGWHDMEIQVAPGAPQTFTIPLSLLTADDIPWINTVGLQVWDHSWDTDDGNLTWTIDEVDSVGTPLRERYLSPHDLGNPGGDLDGAVVNWDSAAITGGADGTQNGLSVVPNDTATSDALRWIDLGGGPGAAIAWGNGRDGNLAKTWPTFPMDLSNYQYVDVRMRAQSAGGVDPSVDLQFYAQTTAAWTFQSAGFQTLPADSAYHVLTFPLAALTDMDLEMCHGIDLQAHSANMDIRVDYVRFYNVPEPASVLLLVAGCLGLVGLVRKRS
jgi:hypothetical protein